MSKKYVCICGQEFDKPQQLSNHKAKCKSYLISAGKQFNFKCDICGRELKTKSGLDNHRKTHEPHSIKNHYVIDKVECEVCGKLFAKNKIDIHIKTHLPGYVKRIPWNKGLTKETNKSLETVSNKIKNNYASGKIIPHQLGKSRTAVEKDKIRNTMLLNPNAGGNRIGSGRGKKGWYKGYFCDSSYELAYVIYNIDHDIKFDRCNLHYDYEYQGKRHKYYPDFILEDGSLVEIKGYKTDIVAIKIASVTDRKITVLYRDDLDYAFDYVTSNYKFSNIEDLYDNQ